MHNWVSCNLFIDFNWITILVLYFVLGFVWSSLELVDVPKNQ